MKKIALISIALAVLGTGAFLLLKIKGFSEQEHERFLAALWQLKHLDTAFNENVLEARFGLSSDYDDLEASEAQADLLVEDLKVTPAFVNAAGQKSIEAARLGYARLLQQRAQFFERFKSENARLANSRRYLPVALDELAGRLGDSSEDKELKATVDDLTRLALTCSATPDEATPEMTARLDGIRDWCKAHPGHHEAKFVASLERHAKVVVSGNGAVDALTRQILALPSESIIGTLFQAYEDNVSQAMSRAQQYKLLLYMTAILIVAGLAGVFWALRRANKTLEQRVEERTRALGRSEERFRTLCVSSPVGIFMADSDGVCSYANPAWERISGTEVSETMGRPWTHTLHPEDRESVTQQWQSVTKTGEAFQRELRLNPRSAETRWVFSQAAAIRTADNEVAGYVGTLEDITERKRAEAALAAAHKQLVTASRLAGMAEVATSVLHNVGNVLNSVNVSALLVLDGLKESKVVGLVRLSRLIDEHQDNMAEFFASDPKARQVPVYLHYLAVALSAEQTKLTGEMQLTSKNIEHIKEIVMMQQSHAKFSGVVEKIKPVELIEDALRLNDAALMRHEVQVVRDFAKGVSEATVDRHKVLQILVNLIRNAQHACDDSSRTDKSITLKMRNGGGRLRISVMDNGVGIPSENMSRIFNHGFTTRKNGHGFGLHSGALAAKEMGGTLNAYSDGPGTGARFILELPLEASLSS